jgi:hypothetical protein
MASIARGDSGSFNQLEKAEQKQLRSAQALYDGSHAADMCHPATAIYNLAVLWIATKCTVCGNVRRRSLTLRRLVALVRATLVEATPMVLVAVVMRRVLSIRRHLAVLGRIGLDPLKESRLKTFDCLFLCRRLVATLYPQASLAE